MPTLNRYVISLCADGVEALKLLHRLAEVFLRKEQRTSALIQPVLLPLEEQAAIHQPVFHAAAASASATAQSIVAEVVREAQLTTSGLRSSGTGASSSGETGSGANIDFGSSTVGPPLTDNAIDSALVTLRFRTLVTTVAAYDDTSDIGRRQILEAAFGSGCAIVTRVLMVGEKWLVRKHPLLGKLFGLREFFPAYFGYCQAVDIGLRAVPERATDWKWAMPDGTDLSMLKDFLEQKTPTMDWVNGVNGAMALHRLLKNTGGKAAVTFTQPIDVFCNKETTKLFTNFCQRTYAAVGAPAIVIPPATGFTITSFFEGLYTDYLDQAFTLDSIQEQVRWLYYGYVRCISFLVLVSI